LGTAVFDRERKQIRFEGSIEEAGGSTEGAYREQKEHEGRSLFWLLVLLPGSASCCLDSE